MLIYLLRNRVNGKRYVGKTKYSSLAIRWSNHVADARKGKNTYIARAILKHGPENFDRLVIARFDNNEALSAAEQVFIRTFDARGHHGYNLTDGGEGTLGRYHSEETRARIRANHPRNWRGKKHTEETKAKMRAAVLGRTRNELGAFI